MADQSQPQTSGLQIPADTQTKFGSLIELVKASESMNDEERQYWINILPVMTPEQIKNLEDILSSEKKQLAAIDAKYGAQTSAAGSASIESIGEKIKNRKLQRQQTEDTHARQEEKHEEEILSQIQAL